MVNQGGRKNEFGFAMTFLYFPSKWPGRPSLVSVEGCGGGDKGQSREISDMLLVVQPIKNKLKQKSLLAAGM